MVHRQIDRWKDNYDIICVKDLNIISMAKNHNLTWLSILDASCDNFLQLLSYKAENAGRIVVKVKKMDI